MPFDPACVAGLLFDLDGTLIDSSADLVVSGNWLRAHAGLAPLDPALIFGYVGDGAEAMVRLLLERPDGDVTELLEAYKRHYHDHCLDGTRLYPGVAPTLEALAGRGFKMAVVTNKPERISRRILEGLGTGRYWGGVIGGNSCANKKPHPEPLFKACGDLGVEPGQCAMVGDSRVDVEAGRNAACQTVGLLGGIGDEGLLRAARPDVLLPRFESLLGLLS